MQGKQEVKSSFTCDTERRRNSLFGSGELKFSFWSSTPPVKSPEIALITFSGSSVGYTDAEIFTLIMSVLQFIFKFLILETSFIELILKFYS